MTKALMILSINPVQAFISQARKMHDLFAGSSMLGDLCRTAINEAKTKYNAKIIFPNENNKSLPNRFLAEIEINDENPKDIADNLEKAVHDKFEGYIGKIKCDDSIKPIVDKQVRGYLNINVVINELSEYIESYKETEKYLGVVKNARSFKQVEEYDRKCSVCGERTAFFYNGNKPALLSNSAQEIKDGTILDKGEALCSICLSKRYYKPQDNIKIPSTAGIAVMDFLEKADKDILKEYKNIFGSYFDEQLLYDENLTNKYFDKFGYSNLGIKLVDIKEKIDKLKKHNNKLNKYYALVMLDGDNMGKWLSGKYLTNNDNLKEFHKNMSTKLGEYGKTIMGQLNEPKGKTIYCGGDDVMAFVNLESLVDVLINLREKYPDFSADYETKNGEKPTASAGIVIAHYKTPLRTVLEKAQSMEKKAKSEGGRDAFAISVMKRSGEVIDSVYKWRYDDSSYVLSVLKDLVNELKADYGLSATFIKNLRREFDKLIDGKNEDVIDEYGKYNDIIETEIKRLIKRSTKRDENGNRKDYKDLTNKIIKISQVKNQQLGLINFFNLLDIADFLSRKVG